MMLLLWAFDGWNLKARKRRYHELAAPQDRQLNGCLYSDNTMLLFLGIYLHLEQLFQLLFADSLDGRCVLF